MSGSLNSVCLAIMEILPGKEALRSMGSIRPLGCHAMKMTPPSGGMFSSSTMLISRNQTATKERNNRRTRRYPRLTFALPGPEGSFGQRMDGRYHPCFYHHLRPTGKKETVFGLNPKVPACVLIPNARAIFGRCRRRIICECFEVNTCEGAFFFVANCANKHEDDEEKRHKTNRCKGQC